MDWKNKTVLITGAEGFIGSHLTERLLSLGAKVKALVMYNSFNKWGWIDTFQPSEVNRLNVICGDIREVDLLKSALKDVDIILDRWFFTQIDDTVVLKGNCSVWHIKLYFFNSHG